jgi:hypothetical protein
VVGDNISNKNQLKEWIGTYLDKYGRCLENYLGHYKNLSIDKAINEAVRGKNLEIHRHQYHVGKERLQDVAEKLLPLAAEIEGFRKKPFDELHNFISCNRIKGFGELAIYDTALRLGAHFNREECLPKDVYLHAGAKKGYVAFKSFIKVQTTDKVKWDDLPTLWKRLKTAYHVENFLCIFKRGEPKECDPKGCCCHDSSDPQIAQKA